MIAAVAALALQSFRYERTLEPATNGPIELVPDGAMYAHAQRDFSDLRVVDAQGAQVPWRFAPQPLDGGAPRRLPAFDQGTISGLAVARVRVQQPVVRATLQVRSRRFVGLATAYGSSDGRTWTRLSTTQVFDVSGAVHARSTTVLLPPNDFRLLEFRVSHVSRIAGVLVAAHPHAPELAPLAARVRTRGSIVTVDLGNANTPVDELHVTASTRRYDRPFTVLTGNRTLVGAGVLVRLDRPTTTVIPVNMRARYLRILVDDGDDPPLRGVRVGAYARPRPLLLEGGHGGALRAYYGSHVRPPSYDWARLPPRALHLDAVRRAALGTERPNPDFRIVDRRSVFAKHRSLVALALALCAGAVIAASAFALRRT